MRPHFFHQLFFAIVLVTSCVYSSAAQAQAPSPDDIVRMIESKLKDRVVLVRHLVAESRARYDENGNLEGIPKVGDWTTHGRVEITAVGLKNDVLQIAANRIGISFEDWEQTREPKNIRLPGDYLIQIALRKGVPFDADKELGKAFLTGAEKAPYGLPQHWQVFVQCQNAPAPTECMEDRLKSATKKPGESGITDPKLTRMQKPSYTGLARDARLEGRVNLRAIVDDKGKIQRVDVLRPLGLGLDERAVESVKQWTFQPAKLNGTPSACFISVDVNFSLKD